MPESIKYNKPMSFKSNPLVSGAVFLDERLMLNKAEYLVNKTETKRGLEEFIKNYKVRSWTSFMRGFSVKNLLKKRLTLKNL